MQYPPFVEFLIATEAEMNKVSWTSRDDLYRATSVVLTTVLLMAVYLFGVDWVWSNLLQFIGVLKFGSGGPSARMPAEPPAQPQRRLTRPIDPAPAVARSPIVARSRTPRPHCFREHV